MKTDFKKRTDVKKLSEQNLDVIVYAALVSVYLTTETIWGDDLTHNRCSAVWTIFK